MRNPFIGVLGWLGTRLLSHRDLQGVITPGSVNCVETSSDTHEIEVNADLYERAKAAAEKRGDNIDAIVIQAIERFIESETCSD